jgi:hypothetical protein
MSIFISLAFGLFQHLGHLHVGNNPISIKEGMINATYKDALSFGAFLSMVLPLILGLFIVVRGKEKIFYFVLFVLGGTMLFHSGSRSALLSMGVSAVLIVFAGLRIFFNKTRKKSFLFKNRIFKLSAALAVVVLLIFGLTVLREDISHSRAVSRLGDLVEKGVFGVGDYQRVSLWKIAGRVMREYPVSGIGIGSFIIEVSNFSRIYDTPIQCSESAENYFLQIGTELGLLGLFLAGWMFWEIFKQIRRKMLGPVLNEGNEFLIMGAAVGIFAFFINTQFHSYIGSYEVKYAFWLLAALLFSRESVSRETKGKTGVNRIAVAAGAAVFLVIGARQLWNASHSLSLKSRTEQLELKQDFGFYEYEQTQDGRVFRWTGQYGGLALHIEKPVIRIPMQAAHPDIKENPVRVSIYLIQGFFKHKRLLDDVRLSDTRWRIFSYRLSEEIRQDVILMVKVDRTWNPLKSQGVPDPRNLGVALGEVRFGDEPR